jgi:hypothetical protein
MRAYDVAVKMAEKNGELTDFDKIMDFLVDEIGIDPSANDIYKIYDAMDDVAEETGMDDSGQFRDLLNDMWDEAEKGNIHGIMDADALD